jgi:hypothetical protein
MEGSMMKQLLEPLKRSFLVLFAGATSLGAAGSITVQLNTSVPSPQRMGTSILLSATAADSAAGPIT